MVGNGGYNKHRKRTVITKTELFKAESADEEYGIIKEIKGGTNYVVEFCDENKIITTAPAIIAGKVKKRHRTLRKNDFVLCVANYSKNGVWGIIYKYLPHELPQIQLMSKYHFDIDFSIPEKEEEVIIQKPVFDYGDMPSYDSESDSDSEVDSDEPVPIFVPSLDDL